MSQDKLIAGFNSSASRATFVWTRQRNVRTAVSEYLELTWRSTLSNEAVTGHRMTSRELVPSQEGHGSAGNGKEWGIRWRWRENDLKSAIGDWEIRVRSRITWRRIRYCTLTRLSYICNELSSRWRLIRIWWIHWRLRRNWKSILFEELIDRTMEQDVTKRATLFTIKGGSILPGHVHWYPFWLTMSRIAKTGTFLWSSHQRKTHWERRSKRFFLKEMEGLRSSLILGLSMKLRAWSLHGNEE